MILLTAAEWMQYLGHFHPVIVHLPIGILFVSFILELVAWKQNASAILKHSIEISLIAGFFSAILACVLGWFLGQEGGYETNTLGWHQWMGIGVAAIAGLAWLMKKKAAVPKVYRFVLMLLFLLLMITGHLGGNMTHGEDYLTAGMPQPVAGWLGIEAKQDSLTGRKPVTDINEAYLYKEIVQPILSEKCYSCHSSKKVKGSLRMDEEALLFKGGKHGTIILPGNAAGSELVKRLSLPMEDDKRMPPKDQPQLSKEEIQLITWWINAGADTKKRVKELQPDSLVMPLLKSFAGVKTADTVVRESLSTVFEETPPAPDQKIIDQLVSKGIIVSPVAQQKHLLEVSCINFTGFDNNMVSLLAPLADHIVWLRLDNTAITDEAMGGIGKLRKLVRLNLAGTKVSSNGIEALKNLQYLEYINIVNTRVDDRGLLILSNISTLKNVYCWNSMITDNGITVFKKKLPEVRIEAGDKRP
ncbi:MAG: c-type cytochrome domain-containing protein [Pseudobacter sp.]|uniref:c-type cytochrome domain-containing protein n=1 Tax=Pseudobacter sp. TaxID=2045420 RepID=UPI003F7FCFF7